MTMLITPNRLAALHRIVAVRSVLAGRVLLGGGIAALAWWGLVGWAAWEVATALLKR
jgi:hypothetical protein